MSINTSVFEYITRITNRYLDAWENFGHDSFTAEELETELLRNRDPEDVPDSSSINQDLYRVVSLGLLNWYGEGEYEVAISPDADEEDWSERANEHMNWVKSEVAEREEEREDTSEGVSEDDDEPEIIRHNDADYMSAFVGPNSDIEGQARYYQAALSPNRHDGVVLRSYQNVASHTDEIAEQICDDRAMSDTDCVYRFETVDEEMEEVNDNLEYRVYLEEQRLLSS